MTSGILQLFPKQVTLEGMAWDKIPRTHSFSLSDFHDFDYCVFRFFVKHHLGKKYQLEEGSTNMTVGSLLDLAIKKLHKARAYNQEANYLAANLIKAAEIEMRDLVAQRGQDSFYGPQLSFLTPEVLEKAKVIFENYLDELKGKINQAISTKTFWERSLLIDGIQAKLWGGPDVLEIGPDGVPEIVDYKYFEDPKKGKANLDMDLMPKLYFLLAANDLVNFGYKKARFRIRSFQDPSDDGIYEEFDLSNTHILEDYFKARIARILRVAELVFCEKSFCKACSDKQRESWVDQIKSKGWIND